MCKMATTFECRYPKKVVINLKWQQLQENWMRYVCKWYFCHSLITTENVWFAALKYQWIAYDDGDATVNHAKKTF